MLVAQGVKGDLQVSVSANATIVVGTNDGIFVAGMVFAKQSVRQADISISSCSACSKLRTNMNIPWRPNMKTTVTLSTLCVLVLCIGCIPSLNPLYTADDLVYLPELIGEWKGEHRRIIVNRRLEKQYRILEIDKRGNETELIGHLVKLGDDYFLDVSLEHQPSDHSPTASFHTVRVHTLHKLNLLDRQLELALPDGRWLERYLKEYATEMPSAETGNRTVLTGSTKQLQAFVTKHSNQFNQVETYVRAK